MTQDLLNEIDELKRQLKKEKEKYEKLYIVCFNDIHENSLNIEKIDAENEILACIEVLKEYYFQTLSKDNALETILWLDSLKDLNLKDFINEIFNNDININVEKL